MKEEKRNVDSGEWVWTDHRTCALATAQLDFPPELSMMKARSRRSEMTLIRKDSEGCFELPRALTARCSFIATSMKLW